jgi:putative membrane protein
MMHWDYGGNAGSWLGMAVVMLLSWVVLAALSYAVVRALLAGSLGRPEPQPPTEADPGRLLDQRLARGDLDPEDYQRRKDLLAQRPAEQSLGTG